MLWSIYAAVAMGTWIADSLWQIPLLVGGALAAGVSGTALLWSVGRVVARQKQLTREIARLLEATEGPETLGESTGLHESLAEQLREIRDVMLLSPQQRRLRSMHLQVERSAKLIERFESAIQRGDFDQARGNLDLLLLAQPDHADLPRLTSRLEETARSVRKTDLQATRQRVEELLSANQFDQATEQAMQLVEKYPDEPLGPQLIEQVQTQKQSIQAEAIRKEYNEVDTLAENRQWTQAVERAKHFLETWPESKEADLVRATLPTLQDTARLAEVRRLRDQIRDLIANRQYAQALKLANVVVHDYPETAAARELAGQIDRLKQRAEQEK
jgi:tetratricopeptide (TPR) repeat protein